jgi:protein involved in sex pheromone biosynthesis
MKKTLILAAIPAALALAACGEAATEEGAPAEAAAVDDNDTAEPEAAPVAEEEPHDEAVPHDH